MLQTAVLKRELEIGTRVVAHRYNLVHIYFLLHAHLLHLFELTFWASSILILEL